MSDYKTQYIGRFNLIIGQKNSMIQREQILFVTKNEKGKNKEIGGLPSTIRLTVAPKLTMGVKLFIEKKGDKRGQMETLILFYV